MARVNCCLFGISYCYCTWALFFFLFPQFLKHFFIWVEKNILTHLKKPKREVIQDSPITSMQTHLWRWWSCTGPVILLWHPHWVTALTEPHYCLILPRDRAHHPQPWVPLQAGGFYPLLTAFLLFWMFVWVFKSFLISLRHRKPVLPWGTAHHTEGCAAKLDTGQRGSIAKLDVPWTLCAKVVTQGKSGLWV